MTRRKKSILISTLSIIPVIAITSTTIGLINSNKVNKYGELDYLSNPRNWSNLSEEEINPNETYLYSFNNNLYSSYDDIINEYMSNNTDAITSNLLYLGEPKLNKNNEISNIEDLREYNRSKIIPAYQKANSTFTSDKEIAKSSYINPTRFITKYSDFNGNLFDTYTRAQESIRATKIPTPILYYDLPDGTKINPLSKTDLKELKTSLYTNFKKYLNASDEDKKDTNIANSNYSLSIYDFASNNDTKNPNKFYSSLNSEKFLNKDNYFKNIIDDVLLTIYDAQLNYLAQNVKFDVKLNVKTSYSKKGKLVHDLNEINDDICLSIDPIRKNQCFVGYKKNKSAIIEYNFDEFSGYPEPIADTSLRKKPLDPKKGIIDNSYNYRSYDPYNNKWKSGMPFDEYNKNTFDKIDKDTYPYVMFYRIREEIGNYPSNSMLTDGKEYWFKNGQYNINDYREKGMTDIGLYKTNLLKEDSIIFPDCKLNEIEDFDIFLSNEKFSKGIDKSGNYVVTKKEIKKINNGHNKSDAEIAKVNFRGANFIVTTFRETRSIEKSTSSKFFNVVNNRAREEGLGTSFSVDLKMSKNSKISEEGMFEFIRNKLNSNYINDSNNSTGEKFSFSVSKVVNQIFELFKRDYNIFSSEIYKMINDNNWSMFYTTNDPNLNIPNSKKLYSLGNNPLIVDRNNQFLFSKTINGNKYFSFSEIDPTSSENLGGIKINYDAIMNEIVGSESIRSNLENNNFRIVIEYNNNPLFLINSPIKFESINQKFETLIKKNFFTKEKPTDDDLDKMINFSQNFMSYKFDEYNADSKGNNYFNVLNDVNKVSFKKDSKEWVFNYKTNDGYDAAYTRPSLKNRKSDLDHLKINAIVDVYNKILNNNGNKEINDLNSPEDIIFLYDKYPGAEYSPIDLKYREFVSNGSNQALSIYHQQATKLFDNQQELDYFIDKNLSLTPGEVNIFYNEDGIPMNPGIKLSEDKKIIPTSDAIYDTKENIYDNLNRTFIVPVSDEKVYYVEDNGKHTLVSNRLNSLYRLKIKRKSTLGNDEKDLVVDEYFTTYDDCWKALNNYITTKTKVARIKK